MTFIIKKGNEEIAKSESKVVTFPNNVPYPIGTVVPAGAYTALNRNFWGDSASVQVPEFEIINSKKPDPIVETKIIVIPGSKTANITDNTDRLTSTDDQLNLYDGDGNLIVTSEGKSNTIQLTGLTASTTYNGYQLSWSNSYGETYKATVPEFKTTAEPLEPISPDHINLIIGITEVTVTYTGEENRTGQVFHVNDLTNSDGAPWTIVIDGLKGNTKYPAGTYKARFSKDDVMSASVNIPEFTTKDYVNPYDPTPSDLVLSDITETSVTITDKNSQGYNRSAEQIRVSKSGSTDDYQGTIGAMSITLTDLNPATEYNNAFWFHWTNPTTGKASGNVAVPKFTTSEKVKIDAPNPANVVITKKVAYNTKQSGQLKYTPSADEDRTGQTLYLIRGTGGNTVGQVDRFPSSIPLITDTKDEVIAGHEIPKGYFTLVFANSDDQKTSEPIPVPAYTVPVQDNIGSFAPNSIMDRSYTTDDGTTDNGLVPMNISFFNPSSQPYIQYGINKGNKLEVVITGQDGSLIDMPNNPQLIGDPASRDKTKIKQMRIPVTPDTDYPVQSFRYHFQIKDRPETRGVGTAVQPFHSPKSNLGIPINPNDLEFAVDTEAKRTIVTDKNTAGVDRTGLSFYMAQNGGAFTPEDVTEGTSFTVGTTNLNAIKSLYDAQYLTTPIGTTGAYRQFSGPHIVKGTYPADKA